MKNLKAACLAFALLANPAMAELEVLAEQDGWSVLRSDTEGVVWCSLQTLNEQGVKFAFNGSDRRDATLLFRDDSFDFERGEQPMVVEIGGVSWQYNMVTDGKSMIANLRDNPRSDDLMDALSNEAEVSLQHANGGPILSWPLAGIDQPFRLTLQCWEQAVTARQ